jgi:membrane-bound ClpP family serine protease
MSDDNTSERRPAVHEPEHAGSSGALRTYIGASLPIWLFIGTIAFLFYRRGELPLWGAAAIVGALVAADLALFPRQRRYYTSEPAHKVEIGGEAVAASDLAPRGFVRVYGELWQAEAIRAEQTIREGDTLRIRGIRGLELLVDRDGDPASPRQ